MGYGAPPRFGAPPVRARDAVAGPHKKTRPFYKSLVSLRGYPAPTKGWWVRPKRIVVGAAYRLRYARPMRVAKRTSIVSCKIAAGVAAIVLAKDLPEFKHLPPNMCIEVEAAQSIAVREAECPTYFVMDPKTGKVMSLVLDGATGYEYAQSLNDGVKRGLVTLIRRPNDR
jgi:hypothetical protein